MVAGPADSTVNPPPAGRHPLELRRAIVAGWAARRTPARLELVLSSMLDRFNLGGLTLADEGLTGWCSVRTLAADRSRSPGTIQRRLAEAEATGLIYRSHAIGRPMVGRSARTYWTIPLPAELVAQHRAELAQLAAGEPVDRLALRALDDETTRAPGRASTRAPGRARSNERRDDENQAATTHACGCRHAVGSGLIPCPIHRG